MRHRTEDPTEHVARLEDALASYDPDLLASILSIVTSRWPEIAATIHVLLARDPRLGEIYSDGRRRQRFTRWLEPHITGLFSARTGEALVPVVGQLMAMGDQFRRRGMGLRVLDAVPRLVSQSLATALVSGGLTDQRLGEAMVAVQELIWLSVEIIKVPLIRDLEQRTRDNQLQEGLRSTVALVLAGGRGSRLGPLSDHVAKPAVHFGGKYRLVDFPLSNCLNSGVRRIAVLTQYRAHALIQHLQRGWGFLQHELNEFVEIWPAQQQTDSAVWYRGTTDAVAQNLATLRDHEPRYVLVLGGDHIYKQDYSRLLAQHLATNAQVTISCIAVPLAEASSFGVVTTDDLGAIVDFVEKPAQPAPIPDKPDRAFVSTGIYLFNARLLFDELERDAASETSSHDFGRDLLPGLLGRCRMFAHRFVESCVGIQPGCEAYWRDVGTLDAYWAANLDLTTVVPALDLYDKSWPIWTYQVPLPPGKLVFDTPSRRGLAVSSLLSAGCIVSGATVRRSLLSTGVSVHSHALVEDTVVLPDADIGAGSRIRRAIVGPGCHIPPGTVIGEDGTADAERFLRTESGIVLVTAQMLDAGSS